MMRRSKRFAAHFNRLPSTHGRTLTMYAAKQLVAEAIGTFFLCFAGIAAIVSTSEPISSGAGLIGIALAHGLALSVAVSIFAGISGAHFNPAVTIGMLSTGRIAPPLA